MTRIRWYGPTVLLLFTIVAMLALGPGLAGQIAYAQTEARISLVKNALNSNPSLAELNEAFAQVAEAVEPSVVSINVKSRAAMRGSRALPPGWREMIPQIPGMPRMPRQDEPTPEGDGMDEFNPAMPFGNGSGWVYDEQGHIVTNNHVIDNADEIEVQFYDGSVRSATVVGTDPNTDVAVLKVEAVDLHPASIAKRDVRQGEIVFAFGSPLQFEFSMSQGIVSAKNRQLGIIGSRNWRGYERFIQTDAAINPGNSGGPLTNIYGEVVGMNTAIASSRGGLGGTPGFMGLGFAIPSDMVVSVVDQLIADGKVTRGFLGIEIKELSRTLAQSYGYDGQGVLVVRPQPGSPADKAGLQSEDIITTVNGEAVRTADELRYVIGTMQPGQEVELGVFRNGESITVTATLVRLDQDAIAGRMTIPSLDEDQNVGSQSTGMEKLQRFGIERLSTFTANEAQRLGVDHQPGVVVEGVREGSVAQVSGITEGTIVTRVMNQDVTTVQELTQAIAQLEDGQPVRFRLLQFNPRTRELVPNIVALQLPQ